MDEGYIKYQCYWTKEDTISSAEIIELNSWRSKLYNLGLIGEYSNGIGFGNLSIRLSQQHQFIITGTQTGAIANLTPQQYTKVTDFDWQQNYVSCLGAIKASSESLTHGALYQANPLINAVIHVHSLSLWQKLLNRVPTTNPDCAYGTPEMAEEIIKLSQAIKTPSDSIIVMSGHEEGIITFGKNLDEAGDILMDYLQLVEPK